MKKIILSFGILLLFLVGCQTLTPKTGTKSNDVLQIELYDAQGKLITGSLFTAGAIVNDVQNVKYFRVSSNIRNSGNVELNRPMLSIGGHKSIIQKFINTYPPFQCIELPYTECTGFSIQCYKDESIGFSRLQCETQEKLLPNYGETIRSELIDVNELGIGEYPIIARAYALYIDENGNQKDVTSEKRIILTIKPDPVKAGISVDIGTSSNTPPPPCIPNCPSGMMLDGDKCLGEPISNEPTTREELYQWSLQLRQEFGYPPEPFLIVPEKEYQCSNGYFPCLPSEWDNLPIQDKLCEDFLKVLKERDLLKIYETINGRTVYQPNIPQEYTFVWCINNNKLGLATDNINILNKYFQFLHTCKYGTLIGDNCVTEPINVCMVT